MEEFEHTSCVADAAGELAMQLDSRFKRRLDRHIKIDSSAGPIAGSIGPPPNSHTGGAGLAIG